MTGRAECGEGFAGVDREARTLEIMLAWFPMKVCLMRFVSASLYGCDMTSRQKRKLLPGTLSCVFFLSVCFSYLRMASRVLRSSSDTLLRLS